MRTTIRYAAYTLAAITVFSLAWGLGTVTKWTILNAFGVM